MKRIKAWHIIVLLTIFLIQGCSGDDSDSPAFAPTPTLSAGSGDEYTMDEIFGPVAEGETAPTPDERSSHKSLTPTGDLIVIISDVHMGDQRSIDDKYGWFIDNEDHLVNFLKHVAVRPAVKEVVIAGDLFDEWVIPMRDKTLNGYTPDQAGESKFVDSIAKAHPGVVNAINRLISKGKKVTYVPGNHDMLVTAEDVSRIFPGIHQGRDAKGLGTYSPQGRSEIIIEHGHRYDFFNAPDMYSNRTPYSSENYTNNPNAIIPPGFFVSKIAATHGVSFPAIPQSKEMKEAKSGPYLYWLAWKAVLWKIHPSEDRDAKIIKSGIDGYTADYSINDLSPQREGLDVKEPLLYKQIEDNWKKRQAQNQVNSPISVASGLLTGSLNLWCDFQANTQYFLHDSSRRIVVFGHTHKATLGYRLNVDLKKCIYANSGTWIDAGDPTRTFVVIRTEPQPEGKTKEYVSVYQFTEKHKAKKLHEDHIEM